MTPQEAIKYAKGMLEDGGNVKKQEFVKSVVEALEKQIPKKPNDIVCPNCGKLSICDGEYGNGLKYCYECGQAIDWESDNQ